ncbi:LAMI_0E14004g1_1 [Lachancea mirantina]|uniref:Ubiquitin carboxyl-terminal hydrolase 2 n=1 Tax=Lachancea mirantina TaxID=1230905 RepID=A0A1G4JR80_9SACH|nr:LAMI_0E14004g1_1 [Lachancea mirantina]
MFQDLPSRGNASDETENLINFDQDDLAVPANAEKDDGMRLLYPNVQNRFPFKTADRLMGEIKTDLAYILADENAGIADKGLYNGILKLPVLNYSSKKPELTFAIGDLLDQVSLQTRYDYKSLTCPDFNEVKVFMGILCNQSLNQQDFHDVIDTKFYHLKVTVKTRKLLERTRKSFGVARYYLVEQLHPFDEPDFLESDSDKVLDSAYYVSSETNKVVGIEILKPEFSNDDLSIFKSDVIRERYLTVCERYADLDPQTIPTQAECLHTLIKIFKGPLNRKSSEDVSKTISADNKILNSQLNPNWLTEKYGFKLLQTQDPENGNIATEFEPPDLTQHQENSNSRALRFSFTRKCLELIFLGKLSASLIPKEDLNRNAKARVFNLYQTTFSSTTLPRLLGDNKSEFDDRYRVFDTNYHVINLCASLSYGDHEIIKNYEIQSSLDPKNIGVYFDALSFIANTKGSYQLLAFCGKQNVVGQESLSAALALFEISPDEVIPETISDDVLLGLYRKQFKTASSQRRSDLKNALRLFAKFKDSRKLKFYVDHEPYEHAQKAYHLLGIDESVDVDVIETAYTIKISDSPGLRLDCDRALYTLAVAKRNLALFSFLDQECPSFEEFYGTHIWSYSEALKFLHVNENASDEVVLEVFQRMWGLEKSPPPDHFLLMRSALDKIRKERNSKLIQHFQDTGIVDVTYLPAGKWPAGLNNIGNTCYLNSLLQYYFCISSLRKYVLEYHETFADYLQRQESCDRQRRIGGREVSQPEVERSIQFVYQLRELFKSMVHTAERFVTPRRELAYLAFSPSNLGVDFESPIKADSETEVIDLTVDNENQDVSLQNDLLSQPSPEVPQEARQEDIELDRDEDGNIHASSTRVAKISPDQLENALELGRQQDVTECIGNVLFQLEASSDPCNLDEDGEQQDLIKELFFGKLQQNLVPDDNPKKIRTKVERFVSLLVNVGDHSKDIYGALDLYFKDDVLRLEEDGQVKRSVVITELPTILQIQIQRVYYDREKFMPFKSIEPLPFNQILYMDRYMDSQDPLFLKQKSEYSQLKEEAENLKAQQRRLLSRNESGFTFKSSLQETRKLIVSENLERNGIEISAKTDLLDTIDSTIVRIDNELADIYQRLNVLEPKIANCFSDFKRQAYTLFAVFIHRGEASYGHYWIYIKDLKRNGIWRKYNDESVTEVPAAEVFNFTEANTATPYFLVYVKESRASEVEPMMREPHGAPTY